VHIVAESSRKTPPNKPFSLPPPPTSVGGLSFLGRSQPASQLARSGEDRVVLERSLWRGSRFGALATCFATCSLWCEPRRVFCFRSLWRVSRRTSEFWQLLVLARMEPVIAAMSKAARRCIRQRVHRCTNASTAFGSKTSVQDRVCGSLCTPAMRATRGFLL
jgi:hypothetical protein